MRKKIFIIHGKGVSRGIGKEGGGDLDTVSSNAFYLVWAKNSLRAELGREPEYGRDYECDFVNYSEGVAHLKAHSGCDVYLPDFPIDALPPRLRMSVIEDEETADLLNRIAAEADDFRLWIVPRAGEVGDEAKAAFNTAYKQIGKLLGHQEKAALLAARSVLALARRLAEIDAWCAERGIPRYPDYLAGFMRGMLSHLGGSKLQDLKKTLLVQMDDNNKERMIDLLNDENAIFAFDEAARLDLSSRGRINYTDELIVLFAEAAAYVVRGFIQLRDLGWKEKPRRDFTLTLKAVLDDLRRASRTLISLSGAVALPEEPRLRELMAGAEKESCALLDLFSRIETTVPVPAAGGERKLMVMVSEEATGKPAEEIAVVFRRLSGAGAVVLPDGSLSREEEVSVATDGRGLAVLRYRPSGPDDEFQFAATFDGLQELRLPVPPAAFDEDVEAAFDEVVEEVGEEEFEEKEEAKETEPDRALQVSLAMMERHFRLLGASDVKVVSIDDHHPFTPEVLSSLQKLEAEGIIGHIQIASLPRGEELPIEKQKCGADLIYAARIRGTEWDNPGLQELVRLAHQHDLHIKIEPASLEISKLIGSRYNKIEIARGLAERVKDLESMRTIMESTGWGEVVKRYEESLEKVFPRIEGIVGRLLLRNPAKPEETARVLAALSPFCDAKKGEAQINVASALHYLLGRKKLATDYFFYCYGSQLMTTRRPNELATMNLSTLCQHIGSRADGGHSGAATCRPSSNPAFPTRRLSRVGDTNFLEFIGYLGRKTGEYAGMELVEVGGVAFEEGPAPIEKALLHLREHAFEITATGTGGNGDSLRLLFVRAPAVNRRAGEGKPSFLQALGYLKRHLAFDYLVFVQGGLYRVILCRPGPGEAKLDLPHLARTIGWRGDGGDQVLATADIKKNKTVKKRLRRMYNPHLVQLASFIARAVGELPGWEVAPVRPVLFGGVEEDFKKICGRMDQGAWAIELAREGKEGEKLTVVAVLSPAIDPAASETEPSLPLVADHFKRLKPNYLIYSESEIRFPKEQAISALMRVDDPGRGIDCSRAVSALAGNQFCGDDAVAEFMPAFLEDSPLGIRILGPENHRDFLEYAVPRMAQSAGYSVVSIKKVT